MISQTQKHGSYRGYSLVDIMIAVVVLEVAVIGTSSYRYYSVLDERKAAAEVTAAGTAALLLESWRGVRKSNTLEATAGRHDY